jgi:hypothetical protein
MSLWTCPAVAFSRGRSTAPFSIDPSDRLDNNSHSCSVSFGCTLSVGRKVKTEIPAKSFQEEYQR